MPRASFWRSLEAVSPVVGVILLSAITVVIAGSLFVVAQGLKDGASLEEKPELAMKVDGSDPQVQVVRASVGLDWVRDMRLSGTCDPTLNGGPFPALPGTLVQASDILECDWGETLVISSSPAQGNAVLFQYAF